MKYKIGVFGSGGAGKPKEDVKAIAREVGDILGEYAQDVIIITGGCSGLPYEAASQAAKRELRFGATPRSVTKSNKKNLLPMTI